tara:strand:- start:48 stop:452 length:405 start_codon:yes stop_codon:yes gene_type:complete
MTENISKEEMQELLALKAEKDKVLTIEDEYGARTYFQLAEGGYWEGIYNHPYIKSDDTLHKYKNSEGYDRVAKDPDIKPVRVRIWINKDAKGEITSMSMVPSSVFKPKPKTSAVQPSSKNPEVKQSKPLDDSAF